MWVRGLTQHGGEDEGGGWTVSTGRDQTVETSSQYSYSRHAEVLTEKTPYGLSNLIPIELRILLKIYLYHIYETFEHSAQEISFYSVVWFSVV